MLQFSQFKEISDKTERLDEKLITFGGKKYGQIVFLAGGAGSGKGFAIKHMIDSSSFKVVDVDSLKSSFLKLARETNKYPELKNLKLSNPNDVFKLHQWIKDKNLDVGQVSNLFLGKDPRYLPNIIFDTTLKNTERLQTMDYLLRLGYKTEDIHLIWVLSDYTVAVKQNRSRERIVPDDILLQTHEGAAKTMYDIIGGKLPKLINGSIHIVLSGKGEVNIQTYDASPRSARKNLVLRSFKYFTIKKPGKPVQLPYKTHEEILNWVKAKIPKTFETLHIFEMYEDQLEEDAMELISIARRYSSALMFAADMASTGRYYHRNKRGQGDGFRELARLWYKANERPEGTTLPRIYCDLDSVLVDFLGGAQKILGKSFTDKEYWEKTGQNKREILIQKNPNFFRDLDWMSDGKKLYSFIRKYDTHILSAVPSWSQSGYDDKRSWLKKHTTFTANTVHLVKREQKKLYAQLKGEPCILIDDHPKNIIEWENAGGIGILHTSTDNTIRELKKYGFA